MIFLDEPNKKVILSVRKCGLITLSNAVNMLNFRTADVDKHEAIHISIARLYST